MQSRVGKGRGPDDGTIFVDKRPHLATGTNEETFKTPERGLGISRKSLWAPRTFTKSICFIETKNFPDRGGDLDWRRPDMDT